MLPEFPRLNAEFDRAINLYMRTIARKYDSVFNSVQQHRVFEGHQLSMLRADGSKDTDGFFEVSSEIKISLDELIDLELPDLLARFEANAEDLVSQRAKHFFDTIGAAVEKAGNTVDAKGQPLSAELYLSVLEKLWIDFMPDGSAKLPTLVVPESAREKAAEMQRELQLNPEFRKRFKAILEQKREEWRAREANRELVG